MYKTGIIGCGKMGGNHIECFRKLADVDVIGVYDVDFNKAKDFSHRYNVKILSDGELKKKLKFSGLKFSKSALTKIEKSGSTMIESSK